MPTKNKKRNTIIIIAVAVVVLIVAGIIIWRVTANKNQVAETPVEEPTRKRRISVPNNQVAIGDRPYTELLPFAQAGRNLRIQIGDLALPATEAEYLIEYSVGKTTAKNAAGRDIAVPVADDVTGIQGSMGTFDLSSFPSISELLLGSCSAGGACTHHTGLSTGTLTITYQAETPYATQQKFDYFEKYDEIAQTADTIFSLEGATLAKATDFVIINSAGLPSGLTGEVLTRSDIENGEVATIPLAYQVAFTTAPATGEMIVSFDYTATDSDASDAVQDSLSSSSDGAISTANAKTEASSSSTAKTGANLTIMAYDSASKTWTALETEEIAGVYSATASQVYDLYALVK